MGRFHPRSWWHILVFLGSYHHPLTMSLNNSGRCLPDVVVAGNGKVVIYDVVLSVSAQKVFIIGPHKKLWIVPETPHIQKDSVFFFTFFDAKRSVCNYSCYDDQNESSETKCPGQAYSSMEFLNDPIENVNVAICDIPALYVDSLVRGKSVRVSLSFLAFNGENTFIMNLPVCYVKPHTTDHVPYASLCCIIRNEGRYLVEWIEYSRIIGIEHFYLYDHSSNDNTLEVLTPYINAGVVTWHNWSFPGYPQREAHSHCTHRYIKTLHFEDTAHLCDSLTR